MSSSHALRKWFAPRRSPQPQCPQNQEDEFARPGMSSGSWCFRAGKVAERSGARAASKLRESGDRLLQCVRVSARERVRKGSCALRRVFINGSLLGQGRTVFGTLQSAMPNSLCKNTRMAIGAAHHGRPSRFLKTAGCQGCWRRSAPRVNMRQVRMFETAVPRRTHTGPEEQIASGA
jgi:hypothetical protein